MRYQADLCKSSDGWTVEVRDEWSGGKLLATLPRVGAFKHRKAAEAAGRKYLGQIGGPARLAPGEA